MTTTPGATPKKTFDFLSPSGDDIKSIPINGVEFGSQDSLR